MDMSFDNTFSAFQHYLNNYFTYKDEINDLVLKSLQNSSKHQEAFDALTDIETLNTDQKKAYQRLSFYLGVKNIIKIIIKMRSIILLYQISILLIKIFHILIVFG